MQQPLFQQSVSASFRLIIFVVLSIVVMSIDHRHQHLKLLRSYISNALYPIQYISNLPIEISRWASESFSTRSTLIKENAALKNNMLRIKASLQKMDSLEKENEHLRGLLGSSSRVKHNVKVAEQVAVNLAPFKQEILVDKGSSDQVYIGQPVIDADGVMGQIVHTSAKTATVLLISDPSHALPVKVIRNGLLSVIAGLGKADSLELLYIPLNADIKVDDMLVTSGFGGKFPADYPVAKITHIEHQPGKAFAQVYASPVAKLDRSREILLVWRQDGHASQPLKQTSK